MASRKPAKKKQSQGHPARRDGASSVPFETEVRQALQPFKSSLFRHFQEEGHPASETRAAIEGLTTLLTVHAQRRNMVDVTTLDPKALGEQLGHLSSLGNDVAVASASILKHYLTFLGTTANFGGSVDDFKQTFEFLSRMAGDSPIVAPFMEDEEANAALESMPFVFAARELLAWVGEGQPSSASGVLSGQTLQDAAGALGLMVTVDESAEPNAAVSWEPADGTVVSSLAEIPRLSAYWDALIGTAMLTYQAPNATPTAALAEALQGSTGAGSRLVKELIAEVLFSHVLINTLETEGKATIAEMTAGVLSSAASATAPRTEFALQVPTVDDLPQEQHHLIASLEIVVPQVEALLRSFEREGLVVIDEHITVPEVLRTALERALAKVSDHVLKAEADGEQAGSAQA
ncbi:hypothetical protein AUR04nite_18500 [Glutamicibacter uratoxydans]|uniref:Uncharacterized protein n=1 Tax=Glutamicibacter uratoxydans TaxID=43667 RepID=A0A4Y4DSI5_GLUUR|nr:hypothetical protein [Glutamicibacter uratoxydans]GED06318.1 hypothetical protein AUR04nite_18500 [Glutamicibacter uratoxydans]